jgi:hypothetical protein
MLIIWKRKPDTYLFFEATSFSFSLRLYQVGADQRLKIKLKRKHIFAMPCHTPAPVVNGVEKKLLASLETAMNIHGLTKLMTDVQMDLWRFEAKVDSLKGAVP